MGENVFKGRKIYISGKISGLSYEEFRSNFDEGVAFIKDRGGIPVDPSVIYLGPEATWEQYMSVCLPLLFQCDGILMLNNWEDSEGAKIEKALSRDKKLISYLS